MQEYKRDNEKKNVHYIYSGLAHSLSLEFNPLFNDFTIENLLGIPLFCEINRKIFFVRQIINNAEHYKPIL